MPPALRPIASEAEASHDTGVPRLLRWLLGLVVLAIAAIAAAYIITGWKLSDDLVRARNPEDADRTVPESVDLHLEVTRPDGVMLDAWVLRPTRERYENSIDTAVVLHGISDQKSTMISLGRRFQRHGVMAILIDLRGHGLSSRVAITYGARDVEDVSAVLDRVEAEGLPLGNVGVYGPSYGAAVAVQLPAHDARVTRVVAVAPFASMRRLVRPYIEHEWEAVAWAIPVAWTDVLVDRAGGIGNFNPDEASPEDRVGQSTARMLLVHSRDDEVVPYQHSVDIVANCGGRCELLTLDGKDHLGSLSNIELRRALHLFMTGREWTGH